MAPEPGQNADMGYFEFEAGDWRVVGVMCSFCHERVEPGDIDPVQLVITARADRPREDGMGSQQSWCHALCLEESGLKEVHVIRPEFWEDTPDED